MEQNSNDFQNNKLRLAREFIGLSQQDVANQIGLTQCIISLLESKGRKQISIAYLTFLVEKGVNLNLLFDCNVLPSEFFLKLKSYTGQLSKEQSLMEQINKLEKIIIFLQEQISLQRE